jgi:REP element-mobilizing transposase RayT
MPLPINIEQAGELYHVTFKTQHDRFSLVKDKDIQVLAAYMNNYKKKHHIKIFAFAFMSNHVHLLLKNSNHEPDAIKYFIRDTKREYAKYQNIRYGEKGNFWSRSYRQKHIEGDIQLINTITYILNNPVEAHLCDNAADFSNSSFHLLLNKAEIKTFNKKNQFINKKELNKIYVKSKKQRYAEGLSDKQQAKRGLSDFIDKNVYQSDIIEGRKKYKRQGPWLHYFPHTDHNLNCKKKYVSLLLTDDMPQTYKPSASLLKKLCVEHYQKSKLIKAKNNRFKIGKINIIYEAKTKEACIRFQQTHRDSLSVNALSGRSVIKTDNGWALTALPGRRRKEA